MGRNKLPIHKLEANKQRQATYSKRRAGIIKKAKDLSILCDVDVLLLIFSTAEKPSLFLGGNSNFEEIIKRYGDVSAQERNKRRIEGLKALEKAFKKVDHEINMEELVNQGSPPVEEVYTDEINSFLNILGPLIDIPNINEIEDVNVLDNLEKGLVGLVNHIQVQKCGMNQFFPQNEEASPFWYDMNGGEQIMLPHNPMLPQSKDATEVNNGYNVPMNAAQELLINPMDEIHETVYDQPADLIPHTENIVSMKINKIDDILQNNGGINGNGNGNGNTNNNFDMKGLPEASSNECDDFFYNLFGQNPFFPEDNVEQGVGSAVHHSNFQN